MKQFILTIVLLVISNICWGGGVVPPHRTIAQSYKIGIIESDHQCFSFLEVQLKMARYSVYVYDEAEGNAIDLTSRDSLDFFIYDLMDEIYVYIEKNNNSKSFRSNRTGYERSSCNAVLDFIYERTQRVNLRLSTGEKPTDLIISTQELLDSGHYEMALEQLTAALSENPEDADIHYHLSLTYEKLGQKPQQLHHLKTGAELNPEDLRIRMALGNYFLENGDYANAIESYSKCLDDPTNEFFARYNLGLLYYNMGNIEEALKYFSSIPENHLQFSQAQKIILLIKEERKQTEERNLYISLTGLALLLVLITFIFYRNRKRSVQKIMLNLSAAQKQEIRSMIIKGHLGKGFQLVRTLIGDKKYTEKNAIALLENRWNEINNDERLGVKSHERIDLEKNRIVKSFLELVGREE